MGLQEESPLLWTYINQFYGVVVDVDADVGLDIASTSALTFRSRIGTSLILGGCVIASVAGCIGLDLGPTTATFSAPVRGYINGRDEDEDNNRYGPLVGAVLSLDKLLVTMEG